jgi:exodeoxyribonuclease V alpha subunit
MTSVLVPAPAVVTADPFDAQVARGARGLLREFNLAFVEGGDERVLTAADVHVATTLSRLSGETDERVLLAVAVAVRALRHGSVCVDLASVSEVDPLLPWPDPHEWVTAVRASRLSAAVGPKDPAPGTARPLRLDLGLLYLERYWRQEVAIAADLRARTASRPVADEQRLGKSLARLFPKATEQRSAAESAVRNWTAIIGGGPGTGKTTTVAKLLVALLDQPGERLRVALAAPTGKAATRLTDAVREAPEIGASDVGRLAAIPPATTLHRLLGWTPTNGRFKHHRTNRLPFDVVVVDEMSMVPLTMMARLLEAIRPDCRLVLVGDPDQLTSVEAGAVLADLVAGVVGEPPDVAVPSPQIPAAAGSPQTNSTAARAPGTASAAATPVVILRKRHRFGGAIGELADAIRQGNADTALRVLTRRSRQPQSVAERSGAADPEHTVELLDPALASTADAVWADVDALTAELLAAAELGDGVRALEALDSHRLLCAHRTGPFGVERWERLIEQRVATALPRSANVGPWYPGRPVLVTANDDVVKLYNGDAGVTVNAGGSLRVVFQRRPVPVSFAVSRMPEVQTMHALTVHRSQGSQFKRVTLILPGPESPLLTRELLYTAVTRASSHARIVGSEESVRAAIGRRAQRASGLRERLRSD